VLRNTFASTEELRELAAYLSSLSVSDVEVVIVAPSFDEESRRVLRWVGNYVVASRDIDPVRAAIDLASCEKVIVADGQVRFEKNALDHLCALLDLHEVVEPQDYLDPMPWWGGMEAGRILIRRGVNGLSDRGCTFGFRRRVVRGLRAIESEASMDPVRRLESQGAEVFCAGDVFVRRLPPSLDDWLRDRPQHFDNPAFYFALLPLACALAVLAGVEVAAVFAGTIALSCLAVAVRGRIGASSYFPLRACFFAPLWVLERSVSVYWSLLLKVTGSGEPARVPAVVGERVTTDRSPTANTR
jgi:hypothetical protein